VQPVPGVREHLTGARHGKDMQLVHVFIVFSPFIRCQILLTFIYVKKLRKSQTPKQNNSKHTWLVDSFHGSLRACKTEEEKDCSDHSNCESFLLQMKYKPPPETANLPLGTWTPRTNRTNDDRHLEEIINRIKQMNN